MAQKQTLAFHERHKLNELVCVEMPITVIRPALVRITSLVGYEFKEPNGDEWYTYECQFERWVRPEELR